MQGSSAVITNKSMGIMAGVLALALLGARPATPQSAASSPTRVHVVAVHDSSLFTLCPPELRAALESGDFSALRRARFPGSDFEFHRYQIRIEPDERLAVFYPQNQSVPVRLVHNWLPPAFLPVAPDIIERRRPDWRQLSAMVSGICPSGWSDPGMKEEICAELHKKRKDYELVDSPGEADVVLLVEGLYHTYQDSESGEWMHYNVRDAFFSPRQLRQAAMAVLIPSEVYRRDATDSEALIRNNLWAGATVWKAPTVYEYARGRAAPTYFSLRSASIQELMSRFFKRAKWDGRLPPIAPAWSMRPSAADHGDSMRPAGIPMESRAVICPGEQARPVSPDQVIRSETVLVTVPVIASDADGRYVPDLDVEDFRLFEDGIEQKVDRLIDESAPFHTALIMDVSHSSTFVRADIENAALAFLESLRPEDEVMVLSMSSVIRVDTELTRDRGRLRSAIVQSALRASSLYRMQWDRTQTMGTRLYDAIDLTVTERLSRIPGRKAILLFTDGVDTGSRLATARSSVARIEESDVLVYAIRYDPPRPKSGYRDADAAAAAAYARGAQYLQELAAGSGGRVFDALRGSDLRQAFSLVAEELRHQYTLCYYPAGPLKEGFHRIQVTVERSGVKVRARPGYRITRKMPGRH